MLAAFFKTAKKLETTEMSTRIVYMDTMDYNLVIKRNALLIQATRDESQNNYAA